MHNVNIYLNIIGLIISIKKTNYHFEPIPTTAIDEPVLYNIFFAFKNGKSEVDDGYNSLSEKEQIKAIWIFDRMVTLGEKFHNEKNIRWKLKRCKYGEIKVKQNRFFFFKVIGNNLIFFGYDQKDQRSLGSARYKQLNKNQQEYEKEFKRK